MCIWVTHLIIRSIVQDTDHFYQQLTGFSDFENLTDTRYYQPLPDNWSVVVTDVEGSTHAIEQGRYKEVNAVGVASIVALLNNLKPLSVPYVFGGDGATLCFPDSCIQQVTQALCAAKELARTQFGLTLRTGLVPIGTLRAMNADVLVAKYQPHSSFQQAMFSAEGLGTAEKLIKDSTDNNPYLIDGDAPDNHSLFEGFECRWNEVPTPHQENISLLIQVTDKHADQNQLYKEIIAHIRRIYISEQHYHPLREDSLSLTHSFKLLSIESRIRNRLANGWQKISYLLKLQYLRLIGIYVMKNNVITDATDWGAYKHRLVINSDFQKFDETLRMIISGTHQQGEQLKSLLLEYQNNNHIAFGLHQSHASLITCMVNDYDKDHIHFVDGANGGYALAALQLKQQLKKMKAN